MQEGYHKPELPGSEPLLWKAGKAIFSWRITRTPQELGTERAAGELDGTCTGKKRVSEKYELEGDPPVAELMVEVDGTGCERKGNLGDLEVLGEGLGGKRR